MKRPTEQFYRELKDNGLYGRTIKLNSYVVTLCQKGGDQVKAVRMEYFQNKTDVYKALAEQYPGWRMKAINRLYEEDFDD